MAMRELVYVFGNEVFSQRDKSLLVMFINCYLLLTTCQVLLMFYCVRDTVVVRLLLSRQVCPVINSSF